MKHTWPWNAYIGPSAKQARNNNKHIRITYMAMALQPNKAPRQTTHTPPKKTHTVALQPSKHGESKNAWCKLLSQASATQQTHKNNIVALSQTKLTQQTLHDTRAVAFQPSKHDAIKNTWHTNKGPSAKPALHGIVKITNILTHSGPSAKQSWHNEQHMTTHKHWPFIREHTTQWKHKAHTLALQPNKADATRNK